MRNNVKKRPRRGEDFLSDVEALVITLENGERVRFNIAREVAIPDDDLLVDGARKAAARFAFWAYQTERALAKLRTAERLLAEEEAVMYRIVREQFHKDGLETTEPRIRAVVNGQPTVKTRQCKLNDLRRQHGMLRAVKDAVEHRTWTIRSLLQRRED